MQPEDAEPVPQLTTLAISADTKVMQMVVQGIHGVQSPDLRLASADGAVTVAVPRTLLAFSAEPGDLIITTLSFVRVGLQPIVRQ